MRYSPYPLALILLSSLIMPLTAAAGGTSYTGNTLPNGPFWARTNSGCSPGSPGFADNVAYQFQNFTVDTSGDYEISSVQDYDGYLHLFENSFDPAMPTVNCIAADDDGATGVGSSLLDGVVLNAGTDYVLVTSAYRDGQFGFFENTISGPGNVTLGASGGDPLPFDSDARMALETLYNSTGGPSWDNSANWLGAVDTECGWFGVSCGPVNGMAGVIGLDLDSNNLTGPVPDVFAAFPALAELQLRGNDLSGVLPPSILQLDTLEILRLSSNSSLSGELADLGQLASAPTLRTLSIGSNDFTGDLAAFFSDLAAMPNLTSLTLFDLPGDPIAVPNSIGQLNLFDLTLDGSNFTAAPFPAALTQANSLQFLHLFDFTFTQPLPAEIADLSNLFLFIVTVSALPGTLPPEIADIPNLDSLIVSFNSGMSGGIPDEVGQLPLFQLDLSENGLGGAIPATLGDATDIRFLDLSGNQHTGALPESFASLTNLSRLDLANNPDLTGTIPAALVDREQQGQLQLLIDNTQLIRSGAEFIGFSGLGGLWYDPALDGSGFNFLALADGLIATFYGYGAGGEQLWLISDLIPAPFPVGQEITDIRMLYGDAGSGQLQSPQPPASLVEWGRMSLRLDTCTEAEAILNGADGQVTMDLQQLAANQDTMCNASGAAQKARAKALDPRTTQLLDQYQALKAFKRAGGRVQPSQFARLIREMYEARTIEKVSPR